REGLHNLKNSEETLKYQGKISGLRDNRTGGNANRSALLSQCRILNQQVKKGLTWDWQPVISGANCGRCDQFITTKKQRQAPPPPSWDAGSAPYLRYLLVLVTQQDTLTAQRRPHR